jgi:ABC-type Na+ efflux pump permease subunit
VHLFFLSLRRQFLSRQTVICLVLSLFGLLIALAWAMQREPSVKKLAEEVLIPVHVTFLLPIFAICFGASSIGGEREDHTLVYLLVTPLPRSFLYIVKYLAAATWVLLWSMGSLAGLCAVAGPWVQQTIRFFPGPELSETVPLHWGFELLRLVWPAFALGALAYAGLFHALGATFRRGTIISLAYTFFLEVLLGNMPGIIKRGSLSFYISCMIYDAGALYGIAPLIARELFLPIAGRSAGIVLAAVSAGFALGGLAVFCRHEYRDPA